MRKVLLGVFICAFLFGTLQADEITIASDDWLPFNGTPGSKNPGYMVEVAQKVFAERGHNIKYVSMPWARAIQKGREGVVNGIIGAYRGDAPDFIFPDNELGMIDNAMFVKKESKFTYKHVSSLQKESLACIIGYDYGEDINAYNEQPRSRAPRYQNSRSKLSCST